MDHMYDRMTHAQKAAMLRLERSDKEHLPIYQGTARALASMGLVEFVQVHGNVRLTEAGRLWNSEIGK